MPHALLAAPFVALIFASAVAQSASNFVFSNDPGPHGVGLRVVEQVDYSRAYRGKIDLLTGQFREGVRARPMQTLIWYPAQKGARPLTYQSYLRSATSEDEFDLSEEQKARDMNNLAKLVGASIDPEQMRLESARPMWAVLEARPETGKFPVIIYAPGFGANAAENADLCEYLASHGYLVIASASKGKNGRAMTKDQEGIEAQVSDIEFLIGYAHGLPMADVSHLAVIGYSWGGVANIFAAAKDNRITALVDLDGSLRYFPKLVDDAKYVTADRINIPMLLVAARPLSIETLQKYQIDVSSSFINQMKFSDVTVVTMMSMDHEAFSSGFLRYAPAKEFKNTTPTEAASGYSWTARYVGNFLDAYLKNDLGGLAFLQNSPEKNGAPNRLISVEVNLASDSPATTEALALAGRRGGYDHLDTAYSSLHQLHPEFKPSEESLNDWANQLLTHDQVAKTVNVLKLAVSLYPESSDTSDALASAYEYGNDKQLAIDTYQKSLAILPDDENAKQHLKLLGVDVERNSSP